MIKCTCKDPKCEKKIRVSKEGLWLCDCKETVSNHLIYLDAKSIVELIHELRNELMDRALKQNNYD